MDGELAFSWHSARAIRRLSKFNLGMPVITRSTVTTNRVAGTHQHTVVPMWTIKLVTAILSIVTLVLLLVHRPYMWQAYPRTFLAITLSSGYLLGWSLPSVLNRFLPFHKVDVALHSFSLILALLALILSAVYLVDQSNYSRTDDYKLMIGIGICLGVEVILLFILVSIIFSGNYTMVDTRG
ncbi:hypothetical protein M3Y96_01191800 [Aphelenchoides besseyi]|nr:hypothetical protein M3Y96_01191800 [Aphelenchoides besseyi]